MYKKLLINAAGLLLSFQVVAESYQFEGNLNYINTKPSTSYNGDADTISASGVYYFSPVNTDNHPLQEASFLGKTSSISLVYLRSTSDSSGVYQTEDYRAEYSYKTKYSAVVAAAETYLWDGFVYLGVVAATTKTEDAGTTIISSDTFQSLNYTNDSKTKDSEENWRVNLGIAPVTGLLIWSEFEKDVDVSNSWNVNAKYVMEFNKNALNLQGGFGKSAFAFLSNFIYPASMKTSFAGSDSDTLDSAYLLGDYYFNNTLSLGVGVIHINDDDYNYDDFYMIRGQKFFTKDFSIRLQYDQQEFQDVYSVGASMRF